MGVANREQAEFWAALAPTWVEIEDQLERVSGPFGRMAMELLGPRPGQRVLDLGCGSGTTTVELATRVGPDGEVVGADIAPAMLARARERARATGVGNVTFVEADLQVHDLGERSFDAAYSRFGVMFFADPAAAFANVRRALRPGGVLAFACWQDVTANEWMLVPGAAVMSVTGTLPAVPGPGEPGPFSLADPERVRSLLSSVGFTAVEVEPHTDVVVIEEADLDRAVEASCRIGAVREALRDADDETRERARACVRDAFCSRIEEGRVRLGAGVLLARAQA